MKIAKKFTSLSLILALILNFTFFSYVQAYSFSFPVPYGTLSGSIDPNQIIQEVNTDSISRTSQMIENRYGFSQDIWRVAQRKTYAPKVEIFFDNVNPKAGEKVTAHAMPEFFKNDPQNLYYTWYLIHTTDGTPKTATNSIESGKKEAAKIMARGDYDPNLEKQNYNEGGADPDSDGWPAVDSNSYKDCLKDNKEDNSKCSFAPMGGADGVGGLEEDGPNTDTTLSEYCGPKPAVSDCVLYTNKSSFNFYYRFNGAQSNAYCNECSSQSLSWGTLTSNNLCCYNILYPDPSDPGYQPYDPGISYCPTTYNAAYEGCFNYNTLKTTNEGVISACLDSKYNECKDSYDSIHEDKNNVEEGDSGEDFSRCYKRNFGTNAAALGFRGYEGSSNTYDNDSSGLDYSVPCKHKWPNAPGHKSGSGKFSTDEEKFWKTDPTDPDTDGDGYVDEADVIGLGHQDFTWTYQTGDRVGVVVEGTSMLPTDEKNAYYKIMWGYLDVCDSTKIGLLDNDQCDDSGDYGYGFWATTSPTDKKGDDLKISLSYSPDNPVADPSDEYNAENIGDDGSILNADEITVVSSLDTTEQNPNLLYYTWQIQRGNPEKDEWGKALDTSGDSNDFNVPGSSGLGLTSFSFTPKKDVLTDSDNDIIYFKVTATVSQSSGVAAGRGRSSVIIPVNKKGVKLDLYKVDISADGKAARGKKICSDTKNENLYTALCPVVKGQIVAAEISGNRYTAKNSNFAWYVNGNPLTEPANASEYFDGWSDTAVFFPITKNNQELEQITVTVTPKDTLQVVRGSRLFTVVEPVALIRSSDTSAAWPRTRTIKSTSLKNSSQEVNDPSVLETYPSSNVYLHLDFVPYYLLLNNEDEIDDNTVVDWQIGGKSVDDENFDETYKDLHVLTSNNGRDLSFTASENIGAYYDIGVNLKKYWSQEEIGIASSVWDFYPRLLESDRSVTITTVEEPASGTSAFSSPTQFLAAVGAHLPHYVMYNLRLALTVFVMFFASFWLYSFTQKIISHEEK